MLGLALLFFCGGVLLAENYKGKLDKIDVDKGTGVIRDDKGPHPFKLSTDTKVVDADGKEIKDGIKGFKLGDELSVTTDGKGKKTVTKEIKLIKKGDGK
jgi:hypothetical protein